MIERLKEGSDEVDGVLEPDEPLRPDLRYRFSFDFPVADHETYTRRYVDLSGLDLANLDDLSEADLLARVRQIEAF